MKKVKNYTELTVAICGKDDFVLAEKVIYKGTNCGTSLQKIDNGVKIGSIVEGVDGDGTEYFDFVFPFEMTRFWETMTEIERQAKQIWNDTHGCEDCPISVDECGATGYHMIDPDCHTCKGEGAVI